MSNGLGVESVAILLRWLVEPSSRDFELSNLIVVTAMNGKEWPDTIQNFEKFMLPMFRAHQIRFVQVGRGGRSQSDGVAVLDDTRAPTKLFAQGAYTLLQELLTSGTVPQFGGSKHLCSLKFKAFAIEKWLQENIEGFIRHTFGYNCGEQSRINDSEAAIRARVTFGFNPQELTRISDAQSYDRPSRQGHYPLAEWGWNRDRCLDYIFEELGVVWRKSACPFCPFARITPELIARQHEFSEETAAAMFLERVALAINPRSQLYKQKPLYQVAEESGNRAALAVFDQLMAVSPWALYRVRRIYRAKGIYTGEGKAKILVAYDPGHKGTADRCVERVKDLPDRNTAIVHLRELAVEKNVALRHEHGLQYLPISSCGPMYPTREEFWVAAPAVVDTKARYGVAEFDFEWKRLFDPDSREQLPLFCKEKSCL